MCIVCIRANIHLYIRALLLYAEKEREREREVLYRVVYIVSSRYSARREPPLSLLSQASHVFRFFRRISQRLRRRRRRRRWHRSKPVRAECQRTRRLFLVSRGAAASLIERSDRVTGKPQLLSRAGVNNKADPRVTDTHSLEEEE